MMELIKPSIQAFLVCDAVICEASTNKKTIVGTFTHIGSATFPCLVPQIGLYVCFTDADGTYEFEIDLHYLNDGGNKIGGGKLPQPIVITDRLSITDIGVTLRNVIFPGPGRYEFRLLSGGQVIAVKDFTVRQG